MERHIFREGTSSCLISSSGSQGGPTLVPPCKPYRQRSPLISCVSLAGLLILCILFKSNNVVITWSPSGYTPVVPDCPDVLSSPCLLITTWQLVKSHGVTRTEPKIHAICYIRLIQKIYIHIASSILIEYDWYLNRSIGPRARTLTVTTTPGQSGIWSDSVTLRYLI